VRHDASCDVLVVGGGIIGLVTAWRAALLGLRTAVADPEPGRGAARVAAGMLAPVTELHYGEQALLELSLVSARRWPEFAAELSEAAGDATGGADLGYRRCGTLAVALDADDRAELRELHAFQASSGLETEWLNGRECRRLEPMLAPGVRGGLRVDGDHQVDPRRLASALLRAAERAGVVLHRAPVARVETDAPAGAGAAGDGAPGTGHAPVRVTGVRLADPAGTRLAARTTVLAAGSRSAGIPGLPAAAVPPVRPVKGQTLRLRVPEPYRPFLSRTVRAVVRGGHVYLVPREDGELVVGATSEELGFDTTVTAGGVYELLRDAHELVPGITELPLVETLAGLRPGSPDNAPVFGRPAGVDGLLLATGHHRNGVLLTPVTGDVLAALLTSDQLPPYAAGFGPDRFSTPTGSAASAGLRAPADLRDPADPKTPDADARVEQPA
jgi:glycine oxidase